MNELVTFLDKIEGSGYGGMADFEVARMAARDAQKLSARIAELEKLVYVPGMWRCAKCGFHLIQSNLNARDGSVTARDTPGDKCPNDGSPLWRVTERENGRDLLAENEKIWQQLQDLKNRKL